MKKVITLLLLLGLCVGLLVYNFTLPKPENGETEPTVTEPITPTEPLTGDVRILNKDPDLQTAWESVAADYTSRTGVPVTVLTAADEAQPTLFTVSGEEELAAVQEQCVDLSGTAAYAQLASWDLALTAEDKVFGIANQVEVFGLVYNSTLLGLTGNSWKDIRSFADLTNVVASITEKSGELGFSAFARVDPSDSFAIQLASLTGDTRDFVDLFLNNATCDPVELGSCTEEDALQDFLSGKAVFFLARSSEYETLAALGTEHMGVLPVYLGGGAEERQSLCAVGTGYWCVRSDAPELDIQATLDFLDYLVQPRENGNVPVDDLGLLAPYRQASAASNILEIAFRLDLSAGKELMICKKVSQIPEGLDEALITYAADPSDENWAAVMALM